MNPWFAKGVILAASVAMIAIRAPHGQRSRSVKVSRSARGRLENALLILAWISFFIPLVWVVSPVFGFAEVPLAPVPLAAGAGCLAAGLWLFHRAHLDLGYNWSITLEVRENHSLVTNGVYRSLRHPMYLAFLLHGVGQALALPNWFAGPSWLVSMALLVALRLGPEERLMRETFGAAYEEYASRSKRLVPRIW